MMRKLKILILKISIFIILFSLILSFSIASEPAEYIYKVKEGEKQNYIFTKVLFQLNKTEAPAGVFDDKGTLIELINITIGTKFIIEVIEVHMDPGVVEYNTTIIGEEELSRKYRIVNQGNLYFLKVTSNRSVYEEMANIDENTTLDGDILTRKWNIQSSYTEYEMNINTGWIHRACFTMLNPFNLSQIYSEIEYKIAKSSISITKGYDLFPVVIPLVFIPIFFRRRQFE